MSDSTHEFWQAVGRGDEAAVRALVAADPSLASARNEQGLSAVMAASYAQQPGVARALAQAGATLDLHEATVVDDVPRVSEFLAADPGAAAAYSRDGFTPLHLAAFFGSVGVMERLLELGVEVNVTSRNPMKVRPIHSAAAFRGQGKGLEMVRRLVDRGAEVNVPQEGGWTPLHQAAAHGDVGLIEYLLQHGADPGAVSADGRTALDMARGGGFDQAAELLQPAAA